MKLFAIICTRNKDLSLTTSTLVNTLSSYGVEVKLLVNQQSIFDAYQKGLEKCDAKDKDIVICCHDDLAIKSTKSQFLVGISKCAYKETGIVGVAGTTLLGEDAVWWNQERWKNGLHKGFVIHHNDEHKKLHNTHYGPHGQVVALDGLFLAARKEVWEAVGFEKPSYFEGEWDFYDIHYTTTAHHLGFKNYTVPINMIHYSSGELVGRDSWHKNRKAFIDNTKLPIRI
tara:strand:- start:23 stop:706 length:684 start_codon:yes stop_codon:yes gene_type:complete